MKTHSAFLGSLALAAFAGSPILFGNESFVTGANRQDDGPTLDELDKAAALFESSCSACHVPPDSAYFVDRAWLSQVKDTA